MTDYDDTNRGALFKNDRKEKDTHPDYRGNINVDGVKKDLAAWLKTSKNGVKYMSLSVSDPYVPEKKEPAPVDGVPFDDTIPF